MAIVDLLKSANTRLSEPNLILPMKICGYYQRSSDRLDDANGYKPKRVKTRIGDLDLSVPQPVIMLFIPIA